MVRVAHKEAVKVLKGTSERKRYIGTISNSFYNGMVPQCISLIPQGSTDTSRVGDTCKPVHVRLGITLSRYINTRVRVIVFQWNADSAVITPSLSSILESSFYAESEYKHDLRKDFKILHDKSYMLNADRPDVIADWSSKLNVSKMYFSAGTTTAHGHIFVAILSNDAFVSAGSYILRHKVEFLDV